MISPETIERLSQEFPRAKDGVKGCCALLEEGVPAPFIARYRKDVVGGMNEAEIRALADRIRSLEELDRRRRSILRSLEAVPGLLTPERQQAFERCPDMQTLEDLYAPIRPKKNEEIEQALQKGLDPLAQSIWEKNLGGKKPLEKAAEFVDEAKGVANAEAALEGAKKILVEKLFDDPEWRRLLRLEIRERGVLHAEPLETKSKGAERFQGLTKHQEPLRSIPSHRMLALRRAEREKALKLRVEIEDAKFLESMEAKVLDGLPPEGETELLDLLKSVVHEAYRRLKERCSADVRLEVKERADDQSILVATRNLRQVLLAPAFGARPVLGIDVGARSAFVLAIDPDGKPSAPATLPVATEEEIAAFLAALKATIAEKSIEGIALGGSAQARVLLHKIRESLRSEEKAPEIVFYSDEIADHYAGSDVGKAEFPDLEKGARSAVFLGRRMQDPLYELVKIEPKSLGMGQYQHDVGKFRLTQALQETLQSCVCRVGVDPNFASETMLGLIPGITPALAKAIIEDRSRLGRYGSREDLKRIAAFEAKNFYLAAPFLRLPGSEQPLDGSSVHPEQIPAVEKLAAAAGIALGELIGNRQALAKLDLTKIADEAMPLTALQIAAERLAEGNRDPRGRFRSLQLRRDVQSVNDLREGMELEGIVSNVTNFGAFIDVGLEHDGLVHISEMADRFVRLPHEIVRVGQIVMVRVLALGENKQRVSLSMRAPRPQERPMRETSGRGGARQAREPREPKAPVIVRAATHRRDGLGKAKEERGRGGRGSRDEKKRGGGGGRGDARGGRRSATGGKPPVAPEEQVQEIEKRESRVERREDRRKMRAARQATASGEAVAVGAETAGSTATEASVQPTTPKEDKKPRVFENNPFKAFFNKREA